MDSPTPTTHHIEVTTESSTLSVSESIGLLARGTLVAKKLRFKKPDGSAADRIEVLTGETVSWSAPNQRVLLTAVAFFPNKTPGADHIYLARGGEPLNLQITAEAVVDPKDPSENEYKYSFVLLVDNGKGMEVVAEDPIIIIKASRAVPGGG